MQAGPVSPSAYASATSFRSLLWIFACSSSPSVLPRFSAYSRRTQRTFKAKSRRRGEDERGLKSSQSQT